MNPRLDAVTHPHFDTAVRRTAVPFLVKDIFATEEGQLYHCGLRAARDSAHDSASELMFRACMCAGRQRSVVGPSHRR